MKLINERTRIRAIIEQAQSSRYGPRKRKAAAKLLNPETATAADVTNLLDGYAVWNHSVCSCCEKQVDVVVQICSEATGCAEDVHLCAGCLSEAVEILAPFHGVS